MCAKNVRRNSAKYRSNQSGSKSSDNLRIIPLGGQEEVGRNMTAFEYKGDIVILDIGMQFPEEDMPGVDYIVPNVDYLEGREDDIKGVVFSHGHLDHIGGAPVVMEQLDYPLAIGRDLTLELVKSQMKDYKDDTSNKLQTLQINSIDQVINLGNFTTKFFQVEHSIMDAVGVIFETPEGTIIHPGDWTLDRSGDGEPNLDYTHLQDHPSPTILMLESLGAVHHDHGTTYEEMYDNLYEIMENAPGRTIIGTFSSQIERIKWILNSAQELGKKVFLDGYSMRQNVSIAQDLGYIDFDKGILKNIRNIDDYPDQDVVVVCTGAQGEEHAALNRMVEERHKHVTLKKKDSVIFSSSIIPGNAITIQKLKDNMYRKCDNVYHNEIMDVHVSGHATREDIEDMVDMIQPDYLLPVYAHHYMLKEAKKVAVNDGYPEEGVFILDNGDILELKDGQAKMADEQANTDYVFVDGLGVTDSHEIVLRDRNKLAEDGMVVVIATVYSKSGELVQNPDIISRGFVYLKQNKELVEDIRHKAKRMVKRSNPENWTDTNQIKNDIRNKIGDFIYSKTERRPMILPVVIEA
ncbi:MAG: ribonuclease J [Candidatus Magasanikbacteria bacterium]